MPKIVTDDQISFYREKGYVKVENVVPQRSIELGRVVCADWVDRTVRSWVDEGLLEDDLAQLDLEHRLTVAWNEAGKPMYHRSPRRQIVCAELFQFMSEPNIIDIAEDLLGTPEVFMHGVFNLRPKLPDQRWTRTPWHQDSQYYPSNTRVHTISIWMPLMRVTTENSCLQVAEGYHRGDMYAISEDEETGFLGISKEERAAIAGIPIEMEAGDALCFTQLTPHAALPTSPMPCAGRLTCVIKPSLTPWSLNTMPKAAAAATKASSPAAKPIRRRWLLGSSGNASGKEIHIAPTNTGKHAPTPNPSPIKREGLQIPSFGRNTIHETPYKSFVHGTTAVQHASSALEPPRRKTMSR